MSGRYEVRDNPNVQSVSGPRSTYQPGGGVLDYRDVGWHIITELNMLLDRAEKAEAALDEAIARADKASNALIRTTAALRETIIRAEKAEARVAELERESESWSRVFKAKTAPQTPVPAPEGTETAQKAPPPSPTGAPRSDRGAGIKTDAQNPGPGRSDPRASESSILDALAFGKSAPVPPARSCEGCKGVTDSWDEPLCPECQRRMALWEEAAYRDYQAMIAKGPDLQPRRATTCEDVDLTKPQTLRAWATFGEASPENSIRITVDPAAAAEVEARTNAVEPLKKQVEAWRDAVLESIPKRRCEGCANGTALAAHSLCPACIREDEAQAARRYEAMLRRGDEFFRTPPRAGLPSRDEVAAFLEALKPPEPPAEPRPCQRCWKPLPPERTWFHAECMNPQVKQ